MLSEYELEALLADIESDRTERKESAADRGRIGKPSAPSPMTSPTIDARA